MYIVCIMQSCILQPLGLENFFTHVLYVTCMQISNHVHDIRCTRDFNVTGQAIDLRYYFVQCWCMSYILADKSMHGLYRHWTLIF